MMLKLKKKLEKLKTKQEKVTLLEWEIEQLWDLFRALKCQGIAIEGYNYDTHKYKLLKDNKVMLIDCFQGSLVILNNWNEKDLQYYVEVCTDFCTEDGENIIQEDKLEYKTIEEAIENYLFFVGTELDECTKITLGIVCKNEKNVITKNIGGITYEKFN